jgi:predicted GNAT family acetyltransferase
VHVFERYLNLGDRSVRCAGLGNVAVDAKQRGRGYARRLMEGGLAECEDEFEMSMLFTHIEGLYERFGFEVIPTCNVRLPVGSSDGWYEAEELTYDDLQAYRREHASRPGSVARDVRYWALRDSWLRAEGWRIFKHRDEDGYVYVRPHADGGSVDEATGGCARRLLKESPGAGTWKARVPMNEDRGRVPIHEAGKVMIRALDASLDLRRLSSPESVTWQTDSF